MNNPPTPGVYLVTTDHGTNVYAHWNGKKWTDVGFLERPAWFNDEDLRWTQPTIIGWSDPQRDVGIEPEGTDDLQA